MATLRLSNDRINIQAIRSGLPHPVSYSGSWANASVDGPRPCENRLPDLQVRDILIPIISPPPPSSGVLSDLPSNILTTPSHRARKVKCDENRPKCRRCTTSRRPCSGYDTAEQSLSWYRPNQLSARNQQEGRAFQFFSRMVSPVLGGPTGAYFWTHLALQFSHFQPAVRHAVLSISSLYEDFARGWRITRQICASSFAIGHYNAAVKRARTAQSEQVVLLLCVLFVCIEYLQGDIDAALKHTHYGIKILNHSACPDWARYHLVPIFRRLALMPAWFGGARHKRLPTLVGFDAPSPTGFNCVAEAQDSIDSIMSRAMGCASEDLCAETRDLAVLLQGWDIGVSVLEAGMPRGATVDRYALCVMRMKALVAGIQIARPAEYPEAWFDQHLDTFRSIIDTAEEASRLYGMAEKQGLMPRSVFSFEMGALPLLSFAVIKCRCLQTRLRGLALLPSVGPAKEGLFDVGTLYRAGRRHIELEHDISLDDYYDHCHGTGTDCCAGLMPPERKRIFDVPVDHELKIISGLNGRKRYMRRVRFMMRDERGGVVSKDEYIYDDEPRRCQVQVPPMRGAWRL